MVVWESVVSLATLQFIVSSNDKDDIYVYRNLRAALKVWNSCGNSLPATMIYIYIIFEILSFRLRTQGFKLQVVYCLLYIVGYRLCSEDSRSYFVHFYVDNSCFDFVGCKL